MMKWTREAEAAVRKVPFFVRKKVRARVEREAAQAGRRVVGLAEVKASQKRYLSNMESEIKGYQLDACFGSNGCSNRIDSDDALLQKIDTLLKKKELLAFLQQHVGGRLKFHHEFRVTISECPNACSQPQIKDIGIIGACVPRVTDAACTACEACVQACRDQALRLDSAASSPLIDIDKCMQCGKCITVCPSGTLVEAQRGYRIQLGGKLGRHPRLARELLGIFSADEVLEVIEACVEFYKQNSRRGRRFADIFDSAVFEAFNHRFEKTASGMSFR